MPKKRSLNIVDFLLGRHDVMSLEVVPKSSNGYIATIYKWVLLRKRNLPTKHSSFSQAPAASFHWLPVFVIEMYGFVGTLSIVWVTERPWTTSWIVTLNLSLTREGKVPEENLRSVKTTVPFSLWVKWKFDDFLPWSSVYWPQALYFPSWSFVTCQLFQVGQDHSVCE